MTGDFNGDGRLDAAVSDNTADRVGVRLGNGDGTFGVERLTGPRDVFKLATADFDHDGKLDLAAGRYRRDGFVRLLGNGDGTFGAASAYLMAIDPGPVAIADLDGDGNADIAENGLGQFKIVVRSGRGDGTFGRRQVVRWDTIGALLVTDVNRDGRPDLITDGASPRDQLGVMVMLNWTGDRAPPCVACPWNARACASPNATSSAPAAGSLASVTATRATSARTW